MKEPIRFIRQKIFTLLNGNVSYGGANIPVYNRVPSSQSEPYIIVYSADSAQTNQNQSDFIVECITRIEVVTAFFSDDGGELQVNDIVESILELIKTSTTDYFTLHQTILMCLQATLMELLIVMMMMMRKLITGQLLTLQIEFNKINNYGKI